MLHLEQRWVLSALRALSPAHGKFLPRIRDVKLHADRSVCTFLARSRNCIMLSVAWHWIENQICMGTKRIYIDLRSVSIFITKCVYLWSQGQHRQSVKPGGVDRLIGRELVDWNNSLFEIGIYHPLCATCSAAVWGILGDQRLLIMITCFNDTICGCSGTPVDGSVNVPFWLILFIVKHPAKTMHVWLSFRKWFACIILHRRIF